MTCMTGRSSKMALSTRTTQFSILLIKTALKSQVITRNGCSCIARNFSTSTPRPDSLPPSFYHRKALLNEEEARTGFVESKEDFNFVERLIPSLEPPTPPDHEMYPTPSGWSPPKGAAPDLPYMVRRTRYHSIPVYLEMKFADSLHLTIIKNIEGDIWALAEELKEHLDGLAGYILPMRVNEVTKQVHFKGMFREEAKRWLAAKGF